jgi:plasmid stabilization system protein ParE
LKNLKVKWTKRAIKHLELVHQYLELNWTENVSNSFIDILSEKIKLVSKYPEISVVFDSDKNIFALLITKHNTLYYKYNTNQIVILAIFDNRMNPNSKNI